MGIAEYLPIIPNELKRYSLELKRLFLLYARMMCCSCH